MKAKEASIEDVLMDKIRVFSMKTREKIKKGLDDGKYGSNSYMLGKRSILFARIKKHNS